MEESGKPVVAVELVISPAAIELNNHKHRLFVKDKNTCCQFMIDNKSNVSLVLARLKAGKPCSYVLYTVNDTEILTFGMKTLTLNLGLKRSFQ